MKKRKRLGAKGLKNSYGYIFISPWILGISLFFIIPFIKSIYFSFSNVKVTKGGVKCDFTGLANYRNILISDPNYMKSFYESVIPILYSLPVILLLSLVLAILLNQDFKGRLFFRSLYFLPVIIATGSVLELLFRTTSNSITDVGVSSGLSEDMINVADIVADLGLSGKFSVYINTVINTAFNLLWSCGIQIVLFLAGLQSIPSSFYEVSKIEGATKWEEFWFITFPSLSRITFLVIAFTFIELITDRKASLVSVVYENMKGAVYDISSAMIWFYFLICGALMGLILLAYNRILMKRWD